MRLRPKVSPPVLEGGVWLALAAVAYGLSFQFGEPLAVYRFGAAGWPRALLLLMTIVALCQMAAGLGWFARNHAPPSPAPSASLAEPKRPEARTYVKRVATFALPLIYLFLLPRVGYYAVTPFFLTAYMYLLGERRLRHLVGTALLIYALVLLAFTRLFFVPLPTGVWPGFYEFSNRFLSLIQ